MAEITMCMIKPDATGNGKTGNIIAHIESKGFRIVAMKMLRLSDTMAREFYAEHEGKEFYEPLLEFIISGPIVAMALDGEDAVKKLRKIIGATDPAVAAEGTIRKLYATDGRRNAVHGSDSLASAKRELDFFFSKAEIQQDNGRQSQPE